MSASYKAVKGKGRGETSLPGVDFYVREGPGKRFIEPRILFLLLRGPAHGYELLGRMEEVPLPGPLPDAGAVYRKLRDMEGKGLVVSDWDDRGGGPRRRVYRITLEGRRRLELWVEAIRGRMEILWRFLDLYEEARGYCPPSAPGADGP